MLGYWVKERCLILKVVERENRESDIFFLIEIILVVVEELYVGRL